MSKFRLRVWRRFRVAPGVTLNLSKRGLSTSLGVRGAHVTVGRRGVRQTIGLPGSGIFLTRTTPWGGRGGPGGSQTPTPPHGPLPRRNWRGFMWVMAALAAVTVINALGGH